MTPQNSLGSSGNAGSSSGASQAYNSVSSYGQPQQDNSQQAQTPDDNQTQNSPADQFIQRVGEVFSPLQSLMQSYPQASTQAEDVTKALSNWISAVNGQLSQQAGGESQSPL